MIATTSVPAIYALSATGFGMAFIAVYMCVVFVTLAGIMYPVIFFSKKLKAIIYIHHD